MYTATASTIVISAETSLLVACVQHTRGWVGKEHSSAFKSDKALSDQKYELISDFSKSDSKWKSVIALHLCSDTSFYMVAKSKSFRYMLFCFDAI